MSQVHVIYRRNHTIFIAEVQNAADDSYVNDASGTVVVKDTGGSELIGSVNFAYQAASDGLYIATVNVGTALDSYTDAVAHVDISGDGLSYHAELRLKPQVNRGV